MFPGVFPLPTDMEGTSISVTGLPAGRFVLFTLRQDVGNDLMLVENFR